MKKLGSLLIAVAVIMSVVIAGAVVKNLFSPSSGRTNESFNSASSLTVSGNDQQLLETGLKTAADKVQAMAPVQVDEATLMTGATSSGSEITYFMKLNQEFGQSDIAMALKNQVCNNEKSKFLISSGATLTYIYTVPSGIRYSESIRSCDEPIVSVEFPVDISPSSYSSQPNIPETQSVIEDTSMLQNSSQEKAEVHADPRLSKNLSTRRNSNLSRIAAKLEALPEVLSIYPRYDGIKDNVREPPKEAR